MSVSRCILPFLCIWPVAMIAGAQTKDATPAPVIQTRDGGANGVLVSIFVPPKASAPFTLTLSTEWSKPLGNGGSYTVANQRRVARDSKGRIYQERWLLAPKGSNIPSQMNVIELSDPDTHTRTFCYVGPHVCEITAYSGSPENVYKPLIGATGALPDGRGFRQHEDLGLSNTLGTDTNGYRETTTLNPGVLGNDQPMVMVREFWYAPSLGLNLISKVDDPKVGKQTFVTTELNTSEPEAKLFSMPEGYRVVDRRGDSTDER